MDNAETNALDALFPDLSFDFNDYLVPDLGATTNTADVDSDQSWTPEENLQQWQFYYQKQLASLQHRKDRMSFITPALPSNQRKQIHAMAHVRKLSHMSLGSGKSKRILITKCKIHSSNESRRRWNPFRTRFGGITVDPRIVTFQFGDDKDSLETYLSLLDSFLDGAGLARPTHIVPEPFTDGEGDCWLDWHTIRAFFRDPADAAAAVEALRDRCEYTLFKSCTWGPEDVVEELSSGIVVPLSSLAFSNTDESDSGNDSMNGRLSKVKVSSGTVLRRKPDEVGKAQPTTKGKGDSHSTLKPFATSVPPSRAPSPLPRKTLTDEERCKMCQYAEAHPTVKQMDIGKLFGVERSTVSKVLRQKEKYLLLSQEPRMRGFGILPETLASSSRDNSIPASFQSSPVSMHTRETSSTSLDLYEPYDRFNGGYMSSESNASMGSAIFSDYGSDVSRPKRKRFPVGMYECSFGGCGKTFEHAGDRTKHEKVHQLDRPYHCAECGHGFLYPKDLRRHCERSGHEGSGS